MTNPEPLKVTVHWSAFSSTREFHPAQLGLSSFFKPSPHPGIFTAFGVEPLFRVVPHSLRPIVGFHEWATSSKSIGPDFSRRRRLPYNAVQLTENITATITSVKAEVFPGQVVARITAQLEIPWVGDLESSLEPLFALRSVSQISVINHLALSLVAAAQGSKEVADFSIDRSYFAMKLETPLSLHEFQSSKDSLQRTLTGLLIGVPNNASLENILVENVERASERMNQKSGVERMLLNRIGLVHVTPKDVPATKGPHLDRFNRTNDLTVLANYCREFLRDKELFKQNELLQAHFLSSKIKMWIEEPELVFGLSYSHTVTWKTLSDALHLPRWLNHWESSLEPIEQAYRFNWESISRSEWWLVPDLRIALENAHVSRGWQDTKPSH